MRRPARLIVVTALVVLQSLATTPALAGRWTSGPQKSPMAALGQAANRVRAAFSGMRGPRLGSPWKRVARGAAITLLAGAVCVACTAPPQHDDVQVVQGEGGGQVVVVRDHDSHEGLNMLMTYMVLSHILSSPSAAPTYNNYYAASARMHEELGAQRAKLEGLQNRSADQQAELDKVKGKLANLEKAQRQLQTQQKALGAGADSSAKFMSAAEASKLPKSAISTIRSPAPPPTKAVATHESGTPTVAKPKAGTDAKATTVAKPTTTSKPTASRSTSSSSRGGGGRR